MSKVRTVIVGSTAAIAVSISLIVAAPAAAKPHIRYGQAVSVASGVGYRLTFDHLYSDYTVEGCLRGGRLKFTCPVDVSGVDPAGFYPSSTQRRYIHTDCIFPVLVYVPRYSNVIRGAALTPSCYPAYYSPYTTSQYFP